MANINTNLHIDGFKSNKVGDIVEISITNENYVPVSTKTKLMCYKNADTDVTAFSMIYFYDIDDPAILPSGVTVEEMDEDDVVLSDDSEWSRYSAGDVDISIKGE